MAYDSQGTTIVWNGITLGEVVSFEVDLGSAAVTSYSPLNGTNRTKRFVPGDIDPGGVVVSVRSKVAISFSNVGLTGVLSISGPDFSGSWSWAMFTEPKARGTVNGLNEYSVTFKLGG
ncbi:hypothetical protein UFOVP898_50 [uncultured Caudovirales phage]|uniref:Uncharacterized protein n=1 Tax=uncultured Caudovirales phage TaxID=2100421 RepID=A0A6J5PWG2_9CAUD|nr:hypothetical protein UFOVP898_50 [uncultured Caudovirales phage]CAB4176183.1 hypothetical protein UFOVP985_9 [uncultured Caudovirales phage]CAB4181616.1 hypothetical protein UFOVP1073_48 [uncultured Caudovirales phage]CAB4197453.1 hypothetical protein UFOVP1308_13 [uncultured Caudovirales phage]CAB4210886.1 hypothetical protein UFOVP1423_56 [uncultured Caudovirales phage]